MKVEVVKLNRKYNLGNYETLDVGYEAILTELEGAGSEAVLKATADLEKLADNYFQMGRFQRQDQPKQSPQPKTTEAAKPIGNPPTELLVNFPEDLRELINVSDVGSEWWITKPYDHTDKGKEDFAKISGVVRALHGKWVSAGKDSRWELPK